MKRNLDWNGFGKTNQKKQQKQASVWNDDISDGELFYPEQYYQDHIVQYNKAVTPTGSLQHDKSYVNFAESANKTLPAYVPQTAFNSVGNNLSSAI